MEGKNKNSNDELFQRPLVTGVLKWTKFSVKGTYVGFVPVIARWRSDSYTVTALCHSESGGDEREHPRKKAELSSRRLQLPLAPARGRIWISIYPATDSAKVVKREDCLSTVVRYASEVNYATLDTISDSSPNP
ncbi:hypothetical protein AVEN_147956-1 [Araneus ventricosus]|uniref:Uncharacterized protein n=1 Tax=Araneus ventricosus TaxID=182803 RepID=A0A4Y2W5I8_ARAVE|nr:hypothetical protein AVEN_33057-1 [Araneus ventricosus]GBO32272.1 hypothetical protein AVEN_147956-1 [Araneus ventricosus]